MTATSVRPFFYGMFVVAGQILNARGVFGPMMWAPIANKAIAIAILGAYLFAFGPARDTQLWGTYTTEQELLLGLGSTLGIVAQFLILLIYLRRVDIGYRPRPEREWWRRHTQTGWLDGPVRARCSSTSLPTR